MKPAYLAAALAALLAAPASAAEHAQQLPPKDARLQSLERWQYTAQTGDQLMHVETTTIGRVGDTGYVWLVSIPNGGKMDATWHRIITDCKGGRIYFDWYAMMNRAGKITFDHDDERRWKRPILKAEIAAMRAACAGTRPAFGPDLTWKQAVEATRRQTWVR